MQSQVDQNGAGHTPDNLDSLLPELLPTLNSLPEPEMTVERARELIKLLPERLKFGAQAAYEPELFRAAMFLRGLHSADFQDLQAAIRKSRTVSIDQWRKDFESQIKLLEDAWEPQAVDHTAQVIELTQHGAAQQLMAVDGQDFRYVVEDESWAWWNGRFWELRADYKLLDRVAALGRDYVQRGFHPDTPENQKGKLIAHGLRLCDHGNGRSVLKFAETIEGARVRMSQFDKRVGAINCLNGTVDLKTGELKPHNREDYCTVCINIQYDPTAAAPVWDRALLKIFQNKQKIVNYVQQLFGYTISGTVLEKVLIVGYGAKGNNGKSLLMSTVEDVLGPYAGRIPSQSLMARRFGSGMGNEFARLRSVRFACTSEAERGDILAVSLLKNLSGREKMAVRFLHKEFFDLEPQFTIWLMCNDRPEAPADDPALWNRLHVIPFETKFWTKNDTAYQEMVDNGETIDALPVDKKEEYLADEHLLDKLRLEQQGILTWLVEGARNWFASGGITKPDEVVHASREYQRSMDTIAGFLDECCRRGDGLSAKSGHVIDAYQEYCRQNGRLALKADKFKKALLGADESFGWERREDARRYTGFTLLDNNTQGYHPHD